MHTFIQNFIVLVRNFIVFIKKLNPFLDMELLGFSSVREFELLILGYFFDGLFLTLMLFCFGFVNFRFRFIVAFGLLSFFFDSFGTGIRNLLIGIFGVNKK